MAQAVQTLANHRRFDPLYHAFLVPVTAINIFAAIRNVILNPGLGAAWFVVLSFAAAVAVIKLRTYALKAQDRVIRLEERMRLLQLMPDSMRSRISELTEAQLIALRFACDAELPALVDKTLSGNLRQNQIKGAIGTWRPDYFRV